MPNGALTRERNIFVFGFIALIVIAQVGGWTLSNSGDRTAAAATGLLAKGAFVYLVFRLSRFLRQPLWLTLLYCALTPFSIMYLIPFVGLLLAVREARKAQTGTEHQGRG